MVQKSSWETHGTGSGVSRPAGLASCSARVSDWTGNVTVSWDRIQGSATSKKYSKEILMPVSKVGGWGAWAGGEGPVLFLILTFLLLLA